MNAVVAGAPAGGPRAPGERVAAIDILRGAVMVLMALDHVRVYAGIPAGGPDPLIFFTRWVTHFCAPAFVFLAGTSAFLYGRKTGPAALSRFLLIRGAWLVLLELTFIRWAWTFNFGVTHAMAGVIWAIGWSMILMAGLVRLPLAALAAFGIAVIAGHNVTDLFAPHLREAAGASPLGWLWQVLYFGGPIGAKGGPSLFVLYSIVPWVGVMAAGYAFGEVLRMEPARRRRLCLWIGLGATALFLLLRGINRYGNPSPWTQGGRLPAVLAFLNPTKYPASLDFLLMTLGPAIALIPALENARGWPARVLTVFGRVPLFYYLLHIPFIHAVAVLVSVFRQGHVEPWLFGNHPALVGPAPEGYMWSPGLLYLIWLSVIVALYFPCRWFAEQKARRPESWLRFL